MYKKRTARDSRLYLNEAACVRNLRHNMIPVVYDIEEDSENYYIIPGVY